MKLYQLYPILRNHQKLSEKRSPMLTQGKVAKFMAYLMVALLVVYLIGISISLALIATEAKNATAYEFMYSFLPIAMTLDFFARFMLQQTPSQQVKPYALLPIPRYTCIDFFIIRSLLSYGNLVMMCLYVPFALMAVVFAEGIGLTILFLLGFYCSSIPTGHLPSTSSISSVAMPILAAGFARAISSLGAQCSSSSASLPPPTDACSINWFLLNCHARKRL